MSADDLFVPPRSKIDWPAFGKAFKLPSLIACLLEQTVVLGLPASTTTSRDPTTPGPAYPLSGDMQATERCSTSGTLTHRVRFSWRDIRGSGRLGAP